MNNVRGLIIDPIFYRNSQLNAQWEMLIVNWKPLSLYWCTLNNSWEMLLLDLYDEEH